MSSIDSEVLINKFKNDFKALFEKAKRKVEKDTKESNIFGKAVKTIFEACSLIEHPGTYFGKKITGQKTTGQNLEDNGLLDKKFYRNEDRLFRILAEVLKDPGYTDLLKSDGFKCFIEYEKKDSVFKNDEIGLTDDFVSSSYFSNLLDDENFKRNMKSFFSAFSDDQLRDLINKLETQEKNISILLGQSNNSDGLLSAIKGSFTQFAAVTAAIAAGIFISFTIGLAIAIVPIVLYLVNKIKIQMLQKQEKNIGAMKTEIEYVLKGRKSKNKENRGDNRLS